MLRSLWLLFIYIAFLGLSSTAPFVAALGYVWIDTFQPQVVAYIILNTFPVAMVMAIVAFLAYLGLDRRYPPMLTVQSVLQIVMAIWVTITCTWAVAGDFGWEKWDWAFKTLVFASFVPLVIRSRVQIEAFAQTYVLSLAANFVPFGLKTLISGGGYGVNLGLAQGNAGFAEGGLLSTVCLMAVPILLSLGKYSLLMPKVRLLPLAYFGIAILAIVTAIGTYERSALVGLGVLGFYMFLRSKRKILFIFPALVMAGMAYYVTSARFESRISSASEYQQDGSAQTRLAVWKWTLGYVATNPLGGGFNSYVIDHIEMPPDEGNPGGYTQFARAFHSIYFEMLGEQGWPGLVMFLTVGITSLYSLRRLSRRTRAYPELAWLGDMSDAVQSGLAVFLSSGAFVGIAFQPMFWYYISLGICLRSYMWRVERQANQAPATGWRAGNLRAAVAATIPVQPGWSGKSALPALRGRPR